MKAGYVQVETINDMGRYISPQEFRWFMDYFENRLDPNRLAMALAYSAGLRMHDAVQANVTWFDSEFKYLQMAQCKPKLYKYQEDASGHKKAVSTKELGEGATFSFVRSRHKPRNVPLPEWLSEDLRAYMRFTHIIKFKGYCFGVGEKGQITE